VLGVFLTYSNFETTHANFLELYDDNLTNFKFGYYNQHAVVEGSEHIWGIQATWGNFMATTYLHSFLNFALFHHVML